MFLKSGLAYSKSSFQFSMRKSIKKNWYLMPNRFSSFKKWFYGFMNCTLQWSRLNFYEIQDIDLQIKSSSEKFRRL